MQAWQNNAPFCYPRPHIWGGKNGRLQRFLSSNFLLSPGPQRFRHTGRASFSCAAEWVIHTHIFSVGASSRPFSDQISSVVTRQETRNASPRFLSFDLHEWTSDTFTFLSRCSCECARIRLHSFEWERKWAPHLDIGASARVYLMNGLDYYMQIIELLSCEILAAGISPWNFCHRKTHFSSPRGELGQEFVCVRDADFPRNKLQSLNLGSEELGRLIDRGNAIGDSSDQNANRSCYRICIFRGIFLIKFEKLNISLNQKVAVLMLKFLLQK